MKKVILLISTVCSLFSCMNNSQKGNEQASILQRIVVDSTNRQDTVFFNYILGESTNPITKKLIADGTLKSPYPVIRTYTMSLGGFSQQVAAEGYPFDLYIGEKKYDALLSLYSVDGNVIDDDGKLMSLRIYIASTDSYPIIDALRDSYGQTNDPPADGYKVEVPQELDVFWNISNKAIYLESFSDFMVLIYEDIIAIRDKNNAEEAIKEAIKQHNLEESQKTKL